MHSFFKNGPAKNVEKENNKEKSVNKPWVEKYRPKKVDDVAHQEEVVSVLKKSLQESNLQNFLFYGPPGTGKTSTILALAHEMYGSIYKDRVLELNASDERGIDVVREKVKKFSQLTANNQTAGSKKCPSFKLIILDEADSMTKSSQEALRRIMEVSTKTTRFCLICNYVSRIIAPIASRCSQFRFKPLSMENQRKRLQYVCEQENVQISTEALGSLILCSEGDLRRSMTFLQTAHSLKGEEGITREDVLEITGVVNDEIIKGLLQSCSSNDFENIKENVTNIIQDGYTVSQVISQMHDEVLSMKITDQKKSEIMEYIAIMDKHLIDGADEYLQLMSLATNIQQQITTN